MILMALAGFGFSMMLVLESVVNHLQLPYCVLLGCAKLLIAVSLAVAMGLQGAWSQLSQRQWKWVWVRGAFGCLTYVLMLLAVVTGAPLGDASALQSVSVVAAALLGRAFLGEPLRWLHGLALCLCVVGAALVCRPLVLLGLAPAPAGRPWLGYGLALAGSASAGGTFIAARKSQGISPFILTASVCLHLGLTLLVLPAVGIVHDVPLEAVFTVPGVLTTAVFMGVLAMALLGTCCLSAGAQLCPAATASTIYTAANMLVGFVAQTLWDREPPQVLSLIGAGLLLLGVAAMAAARSLYLSSSETAAQASLATLAEGPHELRASDSSGTSAGNDEDETASLASFIASEFSGLSASSVRGRSGARQRRTALAAALPAAQAVGAASA